MSHKTDWFYNKKWGLFNHLLGMNRPDWSDYIDSIDVELIADQIAEVNAGYLFLTILQRGRTLLAPNAAFERVTGYKPGEACAKRDFIEDMYQALKKRGIDLMLYYTGDGPLDDPQAGSAFGHIHDNEKVTMDFVNKWAEVLREYSVRYGTKVKGWWVDGCYEWTGYDEPRLKILADAIRAGNPDALIALNNGVLPRVAKYSVSDDYTAGEMTDFTDLPDSRFVDGVQWHLLSYLGIKNWCAPGCRFTGGYMRDYIKKVNDRGGVVTIDFYMDSDWRIDKDQMETLRALKDLR